MRIKRPIRICRIKKPILTFEHTFFSHNIYHSPYCVCPKSNRHNPFIHLYAFCKIHRNIIQSKRPTNTLLRHTVDKHFHMFTTKTIQHHIHIRPNTSRLTQFQTWSFSQSITKRFSAILQITSIYCQSRKCRISHPTHSRRNNLHLL